MNRWNRVGSAKMGCWTLCVSGFVGLGLVGRAWGQNQAIDPVNVAGQGNRPPAALTPQTGGANSAPSMPAANVTPITPAAQPAPSPAPTPAAAPPVAAPPAPPPAPAPSAQGPGAPTQGITPVNVSGSGSAAPPAQGPTVSAPAPQTPSTPTTPAAPAPSAAATPPANPATASAAATAAPQSAATVDEGKAYPLTGLKIDYKTANSEQPPISELMNAEIRLGVSGDAYAAPRAGMPEVTVKLGDVGKGTTQKIYRSGIAAIYGQIVRFYNAKGIIGVFVVVDSSDIDSNDNDIRPPDRTTLQLIVVTSSVKQVRTVAIGETSKDATRVDDPRHQFIRDHSPLQPAAEGQTQRQDLLRKDELDEYVLRLNRYPGRRVDVAISGTNDPGGVTLDYLVSENRPWYVYAGVSNTGTSQTAVWRERFGFVDNQLTGHDDILTLDYMTAGFGPTEAVLLSYELPFFNLDRVRYRAYGSWSEYTASDVGQNAEQFNGTSYVLGNELIANIYQNRELFVDAVGGFKGLWMTTTQTIGGPGKGDYFVPYVGLKLDRATDIATTTGSITFSQYLTNSRLEPPPDPSIAGLGRAFPTQNPSVLQWDFSQTAYLEPLLAPDQFAAGKSTLAHELFVSFRGQYAFNERLFPQAEEVAGGLYSVRGYPESIVAGDTVILATGEYRFHLPRILPIQSDPTKTPFLWDKSFRVSPQQPYGKPDWDMILRAFVDVGQVIISAPQTTEGNSTLVGTGLGVEFQYKQNFNLRIDWGIALTGVNQPGAEVTAGSNRFHISTTILY